MVEAVVRPVDEGSGATGSGARRTGSDAGQHLGAVGMEFLDPVVEARVLAVLEAVEKDLRASVASADSLV
ncbi:MAG TPA: polyprenyl synthetase family protein, partial [Micromonospora sp.]